MSNVHHFSENVSRVTDNVPSQEITDSKEMEMNNLETGDITNADQNKDNQPLEKTNKDDVDQFEIEYNIDGDVEANEAFRNLPDDAKVFIKTIIFHKILSKIRKFQSLLFCLSSFLR